MQQVKCSCRRSGWSCAVIRHIWDMAILRSVSLQMDPYELPEEFTHLQAQDMSKIGFMPDKKEHKERELTIWPESISISS